MQHKSENKKETHSPIALDGLQASEENDRDSTDPVDVESKTINSNNYVYNSNNCTPISRNARTFAQNATPTIAIKRVWRPSVVQVGHGFHR